MTYTNKTVIKTTILKSGKNIDLNESMGDLMENVNEVVTFEDTGEARLQTDDMVIKVVGKNVTINGDVEEVILNGNELT